MSTPSEAARKQPTWCTLPQDKFALVAGRVASPVPENILFTFRGFLPSDDGSFNESSSGQSATASSSPDGYESSAGGAESWKWRKAAGSIRPAASGAGSTRQSKGSSASSEERGAESGARGEGGDLILTRVVEDSQGEVSSLGGSTGTHYLVGSEAGGESLREPERLMSRARRRLL